MVYKNILKTVQNLLHTENISIFSLEEKCYHQVYPTTKEPVMIPSGEEQDLFRELRWIPRDEWEPSPCKKVLDLADTPYAGVYCIPFDNSFLIAPSHMPYNPDLAVIIQEALRARVSEIYLNQQLKQKNLREETLFELHQRLMGSLVLEELLQEMLLFIKDSLGYHNCAILLFNEDQTRLKIMAAINYPADIVSSIEITPEQGITGYAVRHDEVVIVPNVLKDPRYIQSSLEARSEMAIPLRIHKHVIGALDVESEKENFFSEHDRMILEPFAHILAVAIENSRLYRELEQKNIDLKDMYFQTVEALAEAVEVKDPYTSGHVHRSALYGEILARRLGMEESEVENVKLACILHDIGKIGIPGRILSKEEGLTREEKKIMEKHTEIGVQIIRGIKQLRGVVPLLASHHEHFDGSGYPKGLQGDEIPLGARIVAVVDAYDAMITDRPYKTGITTMDAIEELHIAKGIQFDPYVVDSFIEWLGHGNHKQVISSAGNIERPAGQ